MHWVEEEKRTRAEQEMKVEEQQMKVKEQGMTIREKEVTVRAEVEKRRLMSEQLHFRHSDTRMLWWSMQFGKPMNNRTII